MLTLKWEDMLDSKEHKFVVTLDRQRIPYLYSHTFTKSSEQLQGCSVSCREKQRDDVPANFGHCLATTAASCQSEPSMKYTDKPSTVSVVTYNIWNFQVVGPQEMYHKRISRLGKVRFCHHSNATFQYYTLIIILR